jgi:hypothetical protein
MDEPFAALDEQTRMTMGDELLPDLGCDGKTGRVRHPQPDGSGLSSPTR